MKPTGTPLSETRLGVRDRSPGLPDIVMILLLVGVGVLNWRNRDWWSLGAGACVGGLFVAYTVRRLWRLTRPLTSGDD